MPRLQQQRLGRIAGHLLVAFIGGAIVVGMLAWLGILYFWHPVDSLPEGAAPLAPALPAPDPRLSYRGPFKNIHPEVQYVSDAKCAKCHDEHAHTWLQHPMARTLMPISQAPPLPLDAKVHNPFEALSERFQVVERDGKTWHQRSAFDSQGKPLFQHELEAQFAVGSGTHAHSYLTIQGNTVLQTPITWYTQKNIWDISPGFHRSILPGRRVGADCLFCHSNFASEDPGDETSYGNPVFPRGYGIGCQRCHGPGGEHVKNPGNFVQTESGLLDPTIVNPAHLSHHLRESICWQCHLEGTVRVLRRGRQRFDFRPGMPLEDFFGVFEDKAETSFDHVVNHVEQMTLSKCYLKSAGPKKMGCVTCHDPHEKPPPERLAANYRRACLTCHQEQSCALPRPQRVSVSKNDHCVDCHMRPFASGNITHVSSTDHRIPRKPGPRKDGQLAGQKLGDVQELISFFAQHRGKSDPELDRDRALAGAMIARQSRRLVQSVDQELQAAAERDPGDLMVRAQFGLGLINHGQAEAALPIFKDILARQPNHVWALLGAALSHSQADATDEAIACWRRLVKEFPTHDGYRRGLIQTLMQERLFDEAIREARAWLVVDPGTIEPRAALSEIYARLNRRSEAAEQQRIVDELKRRQLK